MKFTITYNSTATQVTSTGVRTTHVSIVVRVNQSRLDAVIEKARDIMRRNNAAVHVFKGDTIQKTLRPSV